MINDQWLIINDLLLNGHLPIVGAFFIACAYYLGKVVWAITFFTFHPSLKWGGKGKENNRKKEMFYAFILFFILYDSFLSEFFLNLSLYALRSRDIALWSTQTMFWIATQNTPLMQENAHAR